MFNHQEIYSAIAPGDTVLLIDGKLALKVISVNKNTIETIVELGGELSDKKGVNFPDMKKSVQVITAKDAEDVRFAMKEIHPEYFALSFVQNGNNIKKLRKLINNDQVKIIAKIETALALKNLYEIARTADALMVARGDMAVEIGLEKVPVMQRRIIATAKKYGKPVIVATEMLMSMVDSPLPTRAEVSDVATAVYLGADSEMLSNETAVGRYPIESVKIMDKIINYTELHKDDFKN